MVESSSTIPLSRPKTVANISLIPHGELNSRAKCLPLRSTSPVSNLVRNKITLKTKQIVNLQALNVVPNLGLSLQNTGLTIDYNSSKDSRFWDCPLDTMDINAATSSAASMFSPATFIWEENFQDLSPFCREPRDSDMDTNKGNPIGVPDDELNTPEIGQINEFDWFSKPLDDGHHDLDVTEKIWKSESKSFSTIYSGGEETHDQNNLLNISSQPEICSDVYTQLTNAAYITDEQVEENITVNELKSEESASGRCDISDLHSLGLSVSTKELSCEEVGANPSVCAPEKVSVPRTLHLNVSDRISAPETLNTPDVLAPLVTGQEFDLVRFVLDCSTTQESVVLPTNTELISHTFSSDSDSKTNSTIEQEVFQENLDTNFTTLDIKPVNENSSSEKSYIVVSSDDTASSLRVIIKQEPQCNNQTQKRRSTRKRSSTGIRPQDNSEDDFSHDSDYDPSPKRKKLSSCAKEHKSECSRYRELRDRNNEASRRSRINRKAREEEMKVQAAELETENQRLRIRAEELEKLVEHLRKALFSVMVKGKSNS